MKYILAEEAKTFLDEKRVLDERFKLAEALSLQDLTKKSVAICAYAKQEKNALDKAAKNDTNDVIERIFEHTDELMQNTRNVKDITILRGYVKDYLSSTKALLKALGLQKGRQQDEAIKEVFAELQKYADASDSGHAARNGMLNELNKINSVIEAFRKSLATTDGLGAKGDESESTAALLTAAYETFYKISKLSDEEYNGNEAISNAVNDLYGARGDLTKFLRYYDALRADNDFVNVMAKLKVAKFKDNAFERAKNSGVDWAARFKRLGDNDEFWEMCFSGIFGPNNVQKIMNLGDAVRQQFKVLGFDASSNFFITFIKKYVIKEAYPIDAAHYNVIHNAIATNQLSLRLIDLVKPQSPLTEESNVIFKKDFYVKPIADCKDYLNCQGELRSYQYDKLSQLAVSDVPTATQPLLKNLQNKTKYPDMKAVVKKILTSDADADQLRPLSEVKEYVAALGIESDIRNKPAWTSKNTPMLVAAIETSALFADKKT